MAFLGSSPQPSTAAHGRHMLLQPQRSQRLKWLAFGCVAMLLLAFGLGGFALARLRSNVHTAEMNVGELVGNSASGPLDILVIGSDTRSGNNAAYGDESDAESGARSDVMMLLQVSEDRQMVNVVSFPRDLMVDIPKCTDAETGQVYAASEDTQINESLERGGPGCTVATISNITGVEIDHFMLVDFNAVKALSSVVGGVQVCVTEDIDDTYSGLKLKAGTSDVEGEQALAFLRSRHGFGDGSDTARIRAQQSFLSSLLRKVQSEGTLSNPTMLYRIAEAVTQNVTVDKGLTDLSTLISVGSIFSTVDLSKVVFATVPNEPYILDDNKLQLSTESEAFFTKLQKDESLVEPAVTDETAEEDVDSLNYDVSVSVSNGSGIDDRGSVLASDIADRGFKQITVNENAGEYSTSSIVYPYGFEAEAQAVADIFGITTLTPSDQYIGIEIVVGADLAEHDKIESQDAGIAAGATGQTADQVTCQQSFNY